MKKLTSLLSAMALSLLLSVSTYAETITTKSGGNVATGVTIDPTPIIICGVALVVAIIAFVVLTILKKKK